MRPTFPARALGVVVGCCLLACVLVSGAAYDDGCDRQNSRDVRRLVLEILMPLAGNGGEPFADVCPLNPALDRFQRQETAKEPLAEGRWRCRRCQKLFSGEQYNDRHLANQHPELERQANSSSCLADWHSALHARHLVAYLNGAGAWEADPLPCRPVVAEQLQSACLELAERCFPPRYGPAMQRLHAVVAGQLCKAHICDKRRKRSRLLAVAKVHRQSQGSWSVVLAAGSIVAAALWLLVWLVATDCGQNSAAYQRGASMRRRLAAAAAAGSQPLLPTVLTSALRCVGAGKSHVQ